VVRDIRYVALGDSYTIGTSVRPTERWPDQLVAELGPDEPSLRLVANLGVNGFTSADVIGEALPVLDRLRPEFVTLLIGVNDVVRRVRLADYERNVVTILQMLLGLLPADRIVTIATPDYTVTLAGANYGDPPSQRARILAVNGAMSRLAMVRGITFVDIFDLSLAAAADRGLVAGDGLHPSGGQYARWVERIAPIVSGLLRGG
jgi:lysophospholipase L1-like esterase